MTKNNRKYSVIIELKIKHNLNIVQHVAACNK